MRLLGCLVLWLSLLLALGLYAALVTFSRIVLGEARKPLTRAQYASLKGEVMWNGRQMQGGVGANGRRDATTNFEVDKTVRVTRAATGTVKRLNAAVVVNHKSVTDDKGVVTQKPLTDEEVNQIFNRTTTTSEIRLFRNGGRAGTRTPDLLRVKQAL